MASHDSSKRARSCRIRIRKLIGAFALFALVIVWALVAMAIAQFPPIFNNPLDLRRSITWSPGIGWVLPAMPLIKWMSTGTGQVTLTGRKPFHSAGGGARDQHLGVALLLEIAVERDARQRRQMVGVLREDHARPRRHRGLEAEIRRRS